MYLQVIDWHYNDLLLQKVLNKIFSGLVMKCSRQGRRQRKMSGGTNEKI